MYSFSKFNLEVQKIDEWLKTELNSVRAGRATPQLVHGIKVDYYGAPTPLEHASTILVQDAKTVLIQPWDKALLPAIEKAISSSSLGINPILDGDKIRLSLPELTAERKSQLAKTVGEKLEESKVSVRRVRSETWEEIQAKEKSKEISEDDKFRLKDELQKKVDAAIEKLDEAAEKKLAEINS